MRAYWFAYESDVIFSFTNRKEHIPEFLPFVLSEKLSLPMNRAPLAPRGKATSHEAHRSCPPSQEIVDNLTIFILEIIYFRPKNNHIIFTRRIGWMVCKLCLDFLILWYWSQVCSKMWAEMSRQNCQELHGTLLLKCAWQCTLSYSDSLASCSTGLVAWNPDEAPPWGRCPYCAGDFLAMLPALPGA